MAGSDALSAGSRLSDRGNRRTAPERTWSGDSQILALPRSPVLWVTWQVSHPMSSAACRLPFAGVSNPVLWQLRQRFSFASPAARLQQLVLVVAGVRVVALHAIANRRSVNDTFNVGSILIGVAGEAKRVRRGRDQLDPRYIFIYPDFVAAQAAHRNRRVNRFPFGLVFMALQALLGVGVLVERNRVGRGEGRCRSDEDCYNEQHHGEGRHPAMAGHRLPNLSCERHLT